ncbi:hypothetical protein ACFRAI_03650 [Streptomyces sp. NPDC056637]|uniref:hypothetical protein n=1 Tax=unclassified Streptomyces TaxID=2593676 RepID=UPI0036360D68
MDLYEEVDDREGWLGAMVTYGSSLRFLGRAAEAQTQHQRLIAFLDSPDRPVSEHVADMTRAHTTYALGLDHAVLGRWSEAAGHHRDAVGQFRRIGMPHMQGSALLGLGEALTELGEGVEARTCLRQVLDLGDAVDSTVLTGARKLLDSLPAE